MNSANAYLKATVGDDASWYFTLVVRIPKLGKVRILISYARADLTGRHAVLVMNCVDETAKQIIERYLQRWLTETFYQDSKGTVGVRRVSNAKR